MQKVNVLVTSIVDSHTCFTHPKGPGQEEAQRSWKLVCDMFDVWLTQIPADYPCRDDGHRIKGRPIPQNKLVLP